jgi:hypothetical protein
MRALAVAGGKEIYENESHRFHGEFQRVLTEHVQKDMDAVVATGKDAGPDAFFFWSTEMLEGVLLCCRIIHGFVSGHVTCCHIRSGPGDVLAVMGLAVMLRRDVYLFVPPHDDAEKWHASTHYKCMQFLCATQLQKRPCIYLVLRSGHFKALTHQTKAPKKEYSFSVLDLFDTSTDPVTSKCDLMLALGVACCGVLRYIVDALVLYMCVACRKIVTQLQRQSDAITGVRRMMSTTAGVIQYLSLTLAVRQDDISHDEVERATAFFEKLSDCGLCANIMSVTERGDKEDRLHLQSMLSGEWSAHKATQPAMKKVIDGAKIFKRAYHCATVLHKVDENRSMESLCG